MEFTMSLIIQGQDFISLKPIIWLPNGILQICWYQKTLFNPYQPVSYSVRDKARWRATHTLALLLFFAAWLMRAISWWGSQQSLCHLPTGGAPEVIKVIYDTQNDLTYQPQWCFMFSPDRNHSKTNSGWDDSTTNTQIFVSGLIWSCISDITVSTSSSLFMFTTKPPSKCLKQNVFNFLHHSSHRPSANEEINENLLMVGVQGVGAGWGPGWAGLWTGEVNLQWVSPRGSHDLQGNKERCEIAIRPTANI